MQRLGYLICLCAFLLRPFSASATPETLEGLIASAVQDHPSVQTQQAHTRAARAGLDSANWQFFPTPSVAVERANTRSLDPAYQGDQTVATLRLQQPLWTGGRLTAGKEKAQATLTVNQTALDEARQQLALRVLQAYCDWLTAHLKIQADERSLATHLRLRDQVKRRIEQGASSESDLVLAMGRLSAVMAEMALANAQKGVALARLGELVGHPVDEAALATAAAAPRPVNPDVQALLDHALATNPSIQKAQAQARVQEAVIAEREADLSPEVYLRAERQHGNFSTADTAPQTRIFLGLSSRFGAGMSNRSEVESARAEHQAFLAEAQAQRRAVSEQVLADHALALSSQARLEALQGALKAATQVSESYDRQFLAGRKTWLDVMNAARELAQTEVQLADLAVSQVLATWRLAIYGGVLAVGP